VDDQDTRLVVAALIAAGYSFGATGAQRCQASYTDRGTMTSTLLRLQQQQSGEWTPRVRLSGVNPCHTALIRHAHQVGRAAQGRTTHLRALRLSR